MKYSTDRPIKSAEQDLLGRSTFANLLGKAIYDYNGEDGLVIGLFGKWGTGKTSVINMAVSETSRLAENDDNKPMIISFAPWNYSDKDNLISLFFQSLKNKINIQGNDEIKQKVGKALSEYAEAFEAISLVPVVGSGAAAILKTLAKAQGKNLMNAPDLDQTKTQLESALREINRKIVIVIDDIDRLTNSQIRDVFQLVKQVADFPNVIYILAMDRDVVRSALSEVHNIDGNEYLEKIIQIPFELPELRKSKLHEIFFSKLEQVITGLPQDVVWDNNYWSNVFRNCIEPYLHTLRDINRVINTFQFRYRTLYQETSFEDMIAITTLEVLEPGLYKWISNNKDAVCGGLMHGFLSYGGKKVEYRSVYHDEFKRLGIEPDRAIKCVATMFPIFAKDVNEHIYGYQPSTAIKGNMRVADEGRYELYFMFDLDSITVPRIVVNNCIFNLDRAALQSAMVEINEQGNIIFFLEEVKALVDKIPYDRLSLIASVMLGLQGDFKGENSKTLFTISACDTAEYLADNILKRFNSEVERYDVIYNALEAVNKDGLGTMASIINRLELSYGRLTGDTEKPDEQLVTLSQLEALEQAYVEKIKALSKSESILAINRFGLVLYLWECLDKTGVEIYINNFFKSEENKLKFICALAGQWHGSNGCGWSFHSKNYSEYISDDEVYSLIQALNKDELERFTESEQVKLASFVLNYNKHEMEHVTEQTARELVSKWKAREIDGQAVPQ